MESPNWTAYNAAQCEKKTRFVELLADLCNTIPQPEQDMGRPRLPLSDMFFAVAYKVYVGFSARRFTSDLKDAYAKGLIGNAAHFNSVNRYIASPELTEPLKALVAASSLPLKAVESDFAVDSSGFSTSRFVRWYNKKYGREVDNREWVKCHLMCGVRTKIVTSVDISGWTAHDTTYFVPLLETTAEHFELGDVLADKAYLSHKNLKAVETSGGTPFVPFKKNTVEPTKEEEPIWAKMYYYFMYNRFTSVGFSTPLNFSTRAFMMFTAVGLMSMPIHWRFRRSATAMVVPQPQKGSRTTSPRLLLAWIMRSNSASGFCVG